MNVRMPAFQMTTRQKKILDEEVKQYFIQKKFENSKRIDATLMLMMHRVFGFGKERLLRFHKAFVEEYDRLCEDYQDDGAAIAAIKLRDETGVDIDELYKQEGLTDE